MSLLTISLPEKPAFTFFLFPFISFLQRTTGIIILDVLLLYFFFLDNVAIDVIVWKATGPKLHNLIVVIHFIAATFFFPEKIQVQAQFDRAYKCHRFHLLPFLDHPLRNLELLAYGQLSPVVDL